VNEQPDNGAAAAAQGRGGQARATAVLVGFMASGKSAVGRMAAERLDLGFVDTDEVIEASHGPIAAIFARGGEALFRDVERTLVLGVLAEAGPEKQLVALGGGAVTISAVRTALSGPGLVVWLTAPADVLWERARRAPQGTRPLAEDEAAFRALLAERDALYREVAGAIVTNDGGRPLDVVVDEVVIVVRAALATRGVAGGSRARTANGGNE
jgi:shikimate kinase